MSLISKLPSYIEIEEDVSYADRKRWLVDYMQFRVGRGPTAINAVRRGFNEVLPLALLEMYTVEELQIFWCGLRELSVEEWRNNTASLGVDPPSEAYLWRWLEEANDNERREVTMF